MTRVRITVDGRAHDVALETAEGGARTVTVAGRTFRIDAVAPEPGTRRVAVTLDGQPHVVERLDLTQARIDGVASTFLLHGVTSGARAGSVGKEGAEVRPPMPGKVVSVRVSAGETVEAGQVLLVLEAMKMQNEVTSPAAGTVTEVVTHAGATVETGDVLLVLGPLPAETEPREAVVA